MRSIHGFIALVAVAATACAGSGAGMAGGAAADSTAAAAARASADTIRSLEQQWSQAAGRHDATAFASFYAADGTIFPPGSPEVTGSDAIQKLISQVIGDTTSTVSFQPTAVYVAASNDMAWDHGTVAITSAAGVAPGKYVVVWKRGSDGSWKVAADIFNLNAPPPAPAPAKK